MGVPPAVLLYAYRWYLLRVSRLQQYTGGRGWGYVRFKIIGVRFKVAVNTIVPRSPFFLFLYLKTQTVTHIRKNAVEYLRQWNGAICVIYNLCQRQKIR